LKKALCRNIGPATHCFPHICTVRHTVSVRPLTAITIVDGAAVLLARWCRRQRAVARPESRPFCVPAVSDVGTPPRAPSRVLRLVCARHSAQSESRPRANWKNAVSTVACCPEMIAESLRRAWLDPEESPGFPRPCGSQTGWVGGAMLAISLSEVARVAGGQLDASVPDGCAFQSEAWRMCLIPATLLPFPPSPSSLVLFCDSSISAHQGCAGALVDDPDQSLT